MMSLVSQAVPFAILLFNSLTFAIARKVASKYSPAFLSSLIREFIATLELCADCAELSVVYEVHGVVGYGVTLFGLCFWWARDWDDAEACPCGPIEDSFLCGIPLTSPSTFMKLLGQILAAYLTWQYANTFWSFHLIPAHEYLHTSPCQAGLQVSILHAALVEATITFVSRLVALESAFWTANTAAGVNSAVTVALCIFALDSSGGFFNPILASALTLNCAGNNLIEHIFVYWMASLTGGIIARTLHMLLRDSGDSVMENGGTHEKHE